MFVKAILHNKEDDLHFLLKCLIEEVREDSILKAKDFGSVKGDKKDLADKQKKKYGDIGEATTIDADLGVKKPKKKEFDSVEQQIKANEELYGIVSFANKKFSAEEIVEAYGGKKGAVARLGHGIDALEGLIKTKDISSNKIAFARTRHKRRQTKAKKILPQLKERHKEMIEQFQEAKKVVNKKNKAKEKALKDIEDGKDLVVGGKDKEGKPNVISNADVKDAIEQNKLREQFKEFNIEEKVNEIKDYFAEMEALASLFPTVTVSKRTYGKKMKPVLSKKEVARLSKLKTKEAKEKLADNEKNIEANELTDKDLENYVKKLDEIIAASSALFKPVEVKVNYKDILETVDDKLLEDLNALITTPKVKKIMNEKLFKDFFRLTGKDNESKEQIISQLDTKVGGKKLNVYLRVLSLLVKELDSLEMGKVPKVRKVRDLIGRIQETIVEVKGKIATIEAGVQGKSSKAPKTSGFTDDVAATSKSSLPNQSTLTFYNKLEKAISGFKDGLKNRKSKERRAAIAIKYFEQFDIKDVLFVIEALYGRIDRVGKDTGKSLEKIKGEWIKANDEVNEKIEAIEEKQKEYQSKEKDGSSPELLRTIGRAIGGIGRELAKALKEREKHATEYRIISGAMALRPTTERGYVKEGKEVSGYFPREAVMEALEYVSLDSLNPAKFSTRPQYQTTHSGKPKKGKKGFLSALSQTSKKWRLAELREKQSKRIKKQDKIKPFRMYDVSADGTVESRLVPMSESSERYKAIEKKILEIKKLLSTKVGKRVGELGEEFGEASLESILQTALKDSLDVNPVDLTQAGQERRKEVEKLAKKLRKENNDLDAVEKTITKVFGATVLNNIDDIEEEINEDVYEFFNTFFGSFTKEIEWLEATIPLKEREFVTQFVGGKDKKGTPKVKRVKYSSIQKIKENKVKQGITEKLTREIASKLNILPSLGDDKTKKPTGEMLEEYMDSLKEIAKELGELGGVKQYVSEKIMQRQLESTEEAKEILVEEAELLEGMFGHYKDKIDDLEKIFESIGEFTRKYDKIRKEYNSLEKDVSSSKEKTPALMEDFGLDYAPPKAEPAEEEERIKTAVEFEIKQNLNVFDNNIKARKKEIKTEGKAETKRSSKLPILNYSVKPDEKTKEEYKGIMTKDLTEEQRNKLLKVLEEFGGKQAQSKEGVSEEGVSEDDKQETPEDKLQTYINTTRKKFETTTGTDESERRYTRYKEVDDSFIEEVKNNLKNNYKNYLDLDTGLKIRNEKGELVEVETSRQLGELLDKVEDNLREMKLPRPKKEPKMESYLARTEDKRVERLTEEKQNKIIRVGLEKVLGEILDEIVDKKATVVRSKFVYNRNRQKKLEEELKKEYEKLIDEKEMTTILTPTKLTGLIKKLDSIKLRRILLVSGEIKNIPTSGKDLVPLIRQYKKNILKLADGAKEMKKEAGD